MEEYKRYMVFEDDQYDRSLGMGSCQKSFDEVECAIRWAKNTDSDYVEIFDRIEGIAIDFKENEL